MGTRTAKRHLVQMFTIVWTHRDLILQLIKRDILNKYRGSFAGLLWSLLSPMLMLSLYTLVFGVFVHLRWPGVNNSLMYSLIIYIGLILFNFFSECLNRAPNLITSNANIVKKIVFPLEIYPWVIVGTALFQALINSIILIVFCLLILGTIHSTILLFPLLFLPLIFFTLGASWFLCSVGVYVRDVTHAMSFILQVLMYLSPVFYATSLLPKAFQTILIFNPLTYIIEQARNSIIFGNTLSGLNFVIYLAFSLCIGWLGFVFFQKTRDGFADVL